MEKLQQWKFETLTVNCRGETIKTTTHTASYFIETLTPSVGLEMVAIPGGTFTMGSPENEGSHYERPQHQVTVSPFFMGKYPVTQAQWRAIASRNDLKVEIELDPDPSNFFGHNRPVEQVNWYEAIEFSQRLSKLTGRDYRLPSEAEWEYACRAVTTHHSPLTSKKLRVEQWNEKYHQPFHFGETLTVELANYDASSTYAEELKGEESKETTPVGKFPPNAFGLYDLHGQVWEWCTDEWHENYEGAPTDGSPWLNGDNNRSPLRGGSWFSLAEDCRSATPKYLYHRRVARNDVNGFRVVCGFGITL